MTRKISPLPDPAYCALQELRCFVARTFCATPVDQLLFTPSILASLKILFAAFGVKRILLGDDEYYTAEHFAGEQVRIGHADELVEQSLAFKPDVVLLSIVSWRGKVADVRRIFGEIRDRLVSKPLLIGDFSHAGAVGFPAFKDCGADVVCGDLAKWVLPLTEDPGIAFLYFPAPKLFKALQNHFAPFYLSGPRTDIERLSRWIDPSKIADCLRAVSDNGIDRELIIRKHRENVHLSKVIAKRVGIRDVQSCILWVPKRNKAELPSHQLIWQTSQGARVLCRADVLPELSSFFAEKMAGS